MPALIHPGAVRHCWDHLVITLRDETSGAETGFVSLYAIAYSATLGAGTVAILDVPGGAGAAAVTGTFADQPDLGGRQQARLLEMGDTRPALRRSSVETRFERIPYGPAGFGYRLVTADHEIEAHWTALEPPFWVDGSNGAFHDIEDIWALMVSAAGARLVVDGNEVPGAPFSDDVWVPKLGRSLSSAHGAFSEVRVQPVSGRATGSGEGGPR
jgi:hypothetical protein